MEEKETNKKRVFPIVILIIGLLMSFGIIFLGILKQVNINSDENKISIENKLEEEKNKLENKKEELKAKGINYDVFTNYEAGEAYDLKIITEALDPEFDYCSFDEYKNNSNTKEYCKLKNELDDISSGDRANVLTPFIILGVFVMIFTIFIFIFLTIATKGMEIASTYPQQNIPNIKKELEDLADFVDDRFGEAKKCPNCGAVVTGKKCEYCRTKIK